MTAAVRTCNTALGAQPNADFGFACEISKSWGSLEPIIGWCKQELGQNWGWQIVENSGSATPGRYIFYFNDEKDYFAFVLKWG